MKPHNRARTEMAAILRDLKWHLTSLHLMGIGDWPMKLRQEEAIGTVESAAAPEHAKALPLLSDLREDLGECTRCGLHQSRTKLVFGEGPPRARLVFVGEGPGFDEDRQGRPFVGRAGKLLDNMIRAMGLRREEVYICNVVKCRPPGNRNPLADEIQTCSPFLFRQLEAIAPQAICALGACAAQTLLATTQAISGLRGKTLTWRGTALVCTFHPAYLLRNPAQKASSWQDLLVLQGILEGHKEGNNNER
jgi:uracil-DNA glycosylase